MKKQKQNTVLNMYGRSMVVPCLKIEMISPAYIMVNWLKHYGKRICSFVCAICAVICSYGNFFWVIFQLVFLSLIINGNTPLTKIFLFQILCFIFFTQSYFFSCSNIWNTFSTDSHNNLLIVLLLTSIYEE